MMANVSARIVARRSIEGHAFTEILHSWHEFGAERFALSRVPYAISDTPFNRATCVEEFKRRQAS